MIKVANEAGSHNSDVVVSIPAIPPRPLYAYLD